MRSIGQLPGLMRRALSLVWAAAPRELVQCVCLQAIAGLGIAVQLLVLRTAIDAILDANGAGSGVEAALPELAALTLVTSVIGAASLIRIEKERLLAEKVSREAADRVLEVAGSVDLLAYETPEFFDRLERARLNATLRPTRVVGGLLMLMLAAFTLVGVTIALVLVEPLMAPLALVAYVPFALATSSNSRAFYDFSFEMTTADRMRTYLFNLISGKEFAKELRGFGLARYLRSWHERLWTERIDRLSSVVRGRIRRSVVASVAAALVALGAVGLLIFLLTEGMMTPAEAATAIGGVFLIGQRLRIANTGTASLYESALFIEDFTSFLQIKDQLRERGLEIGTTPELTDFQLDDVSFTYPGADRPALDRVTIGLRRGQTVALVGENGSGKTTLAKVAAVLHSPDRGRVLWNGTDVAELDPEDVRGAIAVVFQDFIKYHMTAHENIALGDVSRQGDRNAVVQAAERADAHELIQSLPDGYDTLLSRMFTGGTDLSLGQWQKVALARAFFRDADLVIMDEPTAALDPRAEAEIFERVKDLAGDRVLLLISHRFSTVRAADRIYVLHEGRIVEQGAHDELMDRDGHYARMFRLQAAAYRDEATSSEN